MIKKFTRSVLLLSMFLLIANLSFGQQKLTFSAGAFLKYPALIDQTFEENHIGGADNFKYIYKIRPAVNLGIDYSFTKSFGIVSGLNAIDNSRNVEFYFKSDKIEVRQKARINMVTLQLPVLFRVNFTKKLILAAGASFDYQLKSGIKDLGTSYKSSDSLTYTSFLVTEQSTNLTTSLQAKMKYFFSHRSVITLWANYELGSHYNPAFLVAINKSPAQVDYFSTASMARFYFVALGYEYHFVKRQAKEKKEEPTP